MEKADSYCLLFVTCGSEENGVAIARRLVKEKLAACVNLFPSVRSIYSWQDELCDEGEILLLIKARREDLGAIEALIGELHAYEVPEILAISLEKGSNRYLEWLAKATTKTERT